MQITQFFQPPLYWQQFEDLTQAIVKELYGLPHANRVGRPGQAQHGVDVHGRSLKHGEIGIQCKRMDELDSNNNPLPGGPLTRKFLVDEASKAASFSPELKVWILATTAKRDEKVQSWARELTAANLRKGGFEVITWSWDDYVSWLNNFPKLQHWYYDNVIRVGGDSDQDRIIIETIALAFDRPAFTDPIRHEKVDDFTQALQDVQLALRTGEHVERRSRHVIRKAVGGWRHIQTVRWRASLKRIDLELRGLRRLVVDGLKDERLIRLNEYLDVQDPVLEMAIDLKRSNCIDLLNSLLIDADLSPLE